MFNPNALFALIPSLLVLAAWVVGLVVVARHPSRGRWRPFALSGFAALILSRLFGHLPTLLFLLNDGGVAYPSYIMLTTILSVIGLVLEIVGAVLLIAAFAVGHRSAPDAAAPDGSAV